MSYFWKSYVFKVFSVHTKTQSRRFPIPPVGERLRKPSFSWRINVAAGSYSIIYSLPKAPVFFIISFSLCTVPWLMKNQGLAVLAWHKENILRCLASVTNTAVLSVDCVKTHCGPIFSHCRPIIVVAQNETVPVIRASNTFSVKNAKKCLKKREKASVQIRK